MVKKSAQTTQGARRCRGGGGSEIGDFDALDDFYDFFISVSVRGPGGRGSRNRRKRLKALALLGGGSEIGDFDDFDEIDDWFFSHE